MSESQLPDFPKTFVVITDVQQDSIIVNDLMMNYVLGSKNGLCPYAKVCSVGTILYKDKITVTPCDESELIYTIRENATIIISVVKDPILSDKLIRYYIQGDDLTSLP